MPKSGIANVHPFTRQGWKLHTLFWLLFWLALLLINGINWHLYTSAFAALIRTICYAGLVYFNLYILIPRFLSGKSFLWYVIVFLGTILLATPIVFVLLYFTTQFAPEYQAEVMNQRSGLFISNFLVVGFSTLVKIFSDWFRHQRERKDLESQTVRSELKFLKTQINPHFLFNTLNNLYALTLKKSDEAPEIVLKLSEMMRYMLYECNEKRVPLSKEVKYLRNYLDLERIRQGKNVDIKFEVNGEIRNQQIAPLMFIPFVENCFKHGLNHTINQGFIHIDLNVNHNDLDMHISNSKPERLPDAHHKRSGGIGLANVRRRLDLIYENQYELNINDTPNTYLVNLKLDLADD